MSRLTKETIAALNTRFKAWQSPADMLAAVEEAMDGTGSATLFSQGGLAFIRDAWVAAKLAAGQRA